MAERFGRDFDHVEPRSGILKAVKDQIKKENIRDKEIFLCFTCDPYPHTIDTSVTRQIIEVIKNSGNHVRILTKGGMRAKRDFDLLDGNDWFGVTLAGNNKQTKINEPNAASISSRLDSLVEVICSGLWEPGGINTWVSFEPVFDPQLVFNLIKKSLTINMYRIGKTNYVPSDINWGEFGRECERLCKEYGRNYYIKQDLRKEMK
jgi:DNA repair photolyase